MRHDHEGNPQVPRQVQDQLIELGRGNRIEAGRGLVQEQDLGVQRQRPGDGRPLAHAPAELGGHLVRGFLQAHGFELRLSNHLNRLFGQVRELLQDQRDVRPHRQRAEQGAALIGHADLLEHVEPVLALGGDNVDSIDQDRAAQRLLQTDHLLEQGGLAGARAAQNGEDLTRIDIEVDVAQDDHVAVSGRQVPHLNQWLALVGHTPKSQENNRPRRKHRPRR